MEQILDVYCERGSDPSFWAEPANAVTNAGFLLAGALVLRLFLDERDAARRPYSALLILLMFAIGIGSFLFHTLATRWSSLADTLPILFFMLTAVYGLGRRLLGAPWWGALLMVGGFMGLMILTNIYGNRALGGVIGGSLGYVPAAAVLAVAGVWLMKDEHPAGPGLLIAAGVFLASLTFRTIDSPSANLACDWLRPGGYALGTHFIWHILNSVTLYLVARALIGPDGRPRPSTGAAAAA